MVSFFVDPFVFDNKFIKTKTIDPDLESIIITDPFYVPMSK